MHVVIFLHCSHPSWTLLFPLKFFSVVTTMKFLAPPPYSQHFSQLFIVESQLFIVEWSTNSILVEDSSNPDLQFSWLSPYLSAFCIRHTPNLFISQNSFISDLQSHTLLSTFNVPVLRYQSSLIWMSYFPITISSPALFICSTSPLTPVL